MKSFNKNIKAVMAVLIIFIAVSLFAGVIMAVTDTVSPAEGESLQTQLATEENSGELADLQHSSSDTVSDADSLQTDNSQPASQDGEESGNTASDSETAQPSPTVVSTPTPTTTSAPQTDSSQSLSQMKAMWISYLEFQSVDFSSKTAFVSDMTQMFANCRNMGLNTVIVQVRPFGDALYNSSVFPASHLITGYQGAPLVYDPLAEMVKIAHSNNLRIEAWVNPYRVRLSSKMPDNIAQNNPANDTSLVMQANGGVYYNPALSKVQDMVVAGIAEIVENYDVDGIHIDDYFYPSTDLTLDAVQYAESGTTLSQEDWRRENVNTLVRKIYSKIKSIDPSVTFGISPQGNNDNNYAMQYSNVKLWLSQPGYADYIMPQLYWGFGYLTASGRTDYQFVNLCEEWENYPRSSDVKLYIGLGAYRIGDGDGGANDQREWQRGDNLMRMVNSLNAIDGIDGFALYRYDNLFKNSAYNLLAQSEVEHLTEILAG